MSKMIGLILQHVFELQITNKNIENNHTYSTQVNHQTNIGPSAITRGTPTMQNWKWHDKHTKS